MDDFFEGGEEGWGVSLKNNPDYMMCRIYRISLNYDPYLFSQYFLKFYLSRYFMIYAKDIS